MIYLSTELFWRTDFEEKGTNHPWSIKKETLHGGLREGVEIVTISNGKFEFTFCPTRGGGILSAKMGDVDLGWKSPVQGPVNPAFVRLEEEDGLGWLRGFDEFLVRCGLASNGPPGIDEIPADAPGGEPTKTRLTLHGRGANIPADEVRVAIDEVAQEIKVTVVVYEGGMFLGNLKLTTTITTRFDAPGITITDEVQNLASTPAEMQLLYHTQLGTPFLTPGAEVVAAVKEMAPRDAIAAGRFTSWRTYGKPTAGQPEAVYYFLLQADDAGQTLVVLKNAAGDRGFGLRFNTTQLPYFALWQNEQPVEDGYVTGLEPATNFPNFKTFEREQGRVVTLAPGEKRTFVLAHEVYGDESAVATAADEVKALRKLEPKVHIVSNPVWSPV